MSKYTLKQAYEELNKDYQSLYKDWIKTNEECSILKRSVRMLKEELEDKGGDYVEEPDIGVVVR